MFLGSGGESVRVAEMSRKRCKPIQRLVARSRQLHLDLTVTSLHFTTVRSTFDLRSPSTVTTSILCTHVFSEASRHHSTLSKTTPSLRDLHLHFEMAPNPPTPPQTNGPCDGSTVPNFWERYESLKVLDVMENLLLEVITARLPGRHHH